MEWERAIAARVRQIIVEAAGGWPISYHEWVRTAEKFGLEIVRVRGQLSFGACLLDDLIAVDVRGSEAQLCRWIAHEITESVLRSDHGWPVCVPFDSHDHYHRIALLVESGE